MIDNANELLQMLILSGKISTTEIANKESEMKKDKVRKVAKWLPYTSTDEKGKVKYLCYVENDNFKNKRQLITAYSEDKLYDKLYDHYFNAETLETLFKKRQEYSKLETSRTEKTEYEDLQVWNKYLKGKAIVKKDIKSLKTKDFIRFFDNLLKDDPTKKQVDSVKTLLRQIYGQAVMEDIEILCPIEMMANYFKSKDYRQPEQVPGYSEDERVAVLSHLLALKEPDIYDKAIILMFMFPVRIGELKGLKWTDIDRNYTTIYIQRQLDKKGTEKDVKRKSKKGHRYLPISELAKEIFLSIESQGDYILMKDGKTLLTDSFNTRLKKRTTECGVRYLSSHKIRFSNCTTMLKNGMNIRDVQYAMGHTEQRMTEHYNRPIEEDAANPIISVVLCKGMQNVCKDKK